MANRAFVPYVRRDTLPNVGLFGTRGSLPTNPGPVDPPILTGGGGPVANSPVDYRTHLDPGMGQLPPSIQVTGGGPNNSYGGNLGGIRFGPNGALQGGRNGPQGSVYGIDPNTGNPIYNVTGSPRPGFFDSRTGKFVESLGSAGLNMFVPGLGFVSRAIFDAYRRSQARAHTGTDLSGQPQNPTPTPAAAAPSGPLWFQPGYQPSPGIQAAINRGDYTRAYGPTQSSIENAKIMASQSYGGNPNNTGNTGDEGHNIFGRQSKTHGYVDDGVVMMAPGSAFAYQTPAERRQTALRIASHDEWRRLQANAPAWLRNARYPMGPSPSSWGAPQGGGGG